MIARGATWISFGTVVRRTLTTATPTRSLPFGRQLSPLVCYSKSAKGRKLPRNHFTSNHHKLEEKNALQGKDKDKEQRSLQPKRKTKAGSTSLRRVAVEAERSQKLIKGTGKRAYVDPEAPSKDVAAYCAAETYNLHIARQLLLKEGYGPSDPHDSGLFPQVLHFETPDYIIKDPESNLETRHGTGDVFVFPSGSVVTWNVPDAQAESIVHRILPPAATEPHLSNIETEDLTYIEDPARDTSKILGDTIILGTASSSSSSSTSSDHTDPSTTSNENTTLAKIAFSSALARSAKLAVLENALNAYFSTTRSIPQTLSSGRKLRFTRAFILRKTGELLNIRAQLNIYSELTDSLPDLFWDSPYELGLEGYYEQLGRALDVNVRIKVLNERMDYAREIAEVLRERLSEKHSTGLEWLIIGLIAIEVGFGILHLWNERADRLDPESTKALLTAWLEKELKKEKK